MSILHVDLNSFYAHCSIRHSGGKYRNDMPIIIGGDPAKRHGIVLAATYVVKRQGIHAGMPIIKAVQLCPEAIVIPPDYRLYTVCSEQFMNIVREYSPTIMRYGIDEAYIDYTGCEHLFGSAKEVAYAIKERVKLELGITVSVGVGDNPLMAKMGSDYKKPDAVTIVDGEFWRKNIMPLSVDKLMYIGRSTAKRLNEMGIYTIGELALTSESMLVAVFGVMGRQMWQHANGIDKPRLERSEAVHKSMSCACTFPENLKEISEYHAAILTQLDKVSYRMRITGQKALGVGVSVRYSDLSYKSKQIKLNRATDITDELYAASLKIADGLYGSKPIRQVGVKLFDLSSFGEQLLLIDDDVHEKRKKADNAIDSIRERFGMQSIFRGATVMQSLQEVVENDFDPFDRC